MQNFQPCYSTPPAAADATAVHAPGWLQHPQKRRSPASCYADNQRRTPIIPKPRFFHCLPHYLVHLLVRPRALDVCHLECGLGLIPGVWHQQSIEK
jgi:hypothetical protein